MIYCYAHGQNQGHGELVYDCLITRCDHRRGTAPSAMNRLTPQGCIHHELDPHHGSRGGAYGPRCFHPKLNTRTHTLGMPTR